MIFDELAAVYASRGSATYFGEAVSMREHGLQAAHFARSCGAAPELVVAALLHDVGHLVENVPDDIADWKIDAHHEDSGSRWLRQHFPDAVTEPVRMHVAAKRWLCATEPAYAAALSTASQHTLRLQGGSMSAAEIAAFEAHPFHREAVLLRRCDDQGKIANMKTRDFASYRALIEACAGGRAR